MYSYNISKKADENAFFNTCALIESNVTNLTKEKLLMDVDGTQIQIYITPKGKIKVYNDYEVGAVYVDSEKELKGII